MSADATSVGINDSWSYAAGTYLRVGIPIVMTLALGGCAGTVTTQNKSQVWYCLGLCAFLQNTTDTNHNGEVTNEE